MQILLANAKIMNDKAKRPPLTTPRFQQMAEKMAEEMASMNVEELSRLLGCSTKIAAENWQRYYNFATAEKMPALLAYNGQAYRHPCLRQTRQTYFTHTYKYSLKHTSS